MFAIALFIKANPHLIEEADASFQEGLPEMERLQRRNDFLSLALEKEAGLQGMSAWDYQRKLIADSGMSVLEVRQGEKKSTNISPTTRYLH
ncbi:hypothetical protein AO391_26565 [Pseudomonas marginalis ICMP 9505]|nr:hypothetical protein AO391_26565 [Pseudomonas marginalis ICMP 9505]